MGGYLWCSLEILYSDFVFPEMYMVARYVTYPSKSKSKSRRPESVNGPLSSLVPPSTVNSVSATPSPSHSPAPTLPLVGLSLPPEAVLHCTAVSRLCCKIGRITIPPAVVIASTGVSNSSNFLVNITSNLSVFSLASLNENFVLLVWDYPLAIR